MVIALKNRKKMARDVSGYIPTPVIVSR